MGAVKTFSLPDPGEGLTEAEIVTWRVKSGDVVRVNDIVVEIETAKSLVELPVPFAGTVAELLVAEGDTVDVGTPIIAVDTGEALSASGDEASAPTGAIEPGMVGGRAPGGRTSVLVGYGPRESQARRRPRIDPVRAAAPGAAAPPAAAGRAAPVGRYRLVRVLAKPPVRKYAKDLGIDLGHVQPGADGVVNRADVDAYRSARAVENARLPAVAGAPREGTQRETRIAVKGVRRASAAAMVESAFTAPHVTEFVTVDVTRTMRLVRRLRRDPEFAGTKVSPLLVVARALVLAVRRHPGVNASWDEGAGEIVVKHFVNLGIAAATPRGLVVPNVKDADRLTLRELADQLSVLVATARDGRTQPAEMAGGTITITNVGVFGIDTGTPILNPGEAAILAFGAVRRLPWVVHGTVRPRWVTTLALSFDHRLIDGELGSRFLADLAAILERPDQALVWA